MDLIEHFSARVNHAKERLERASEFRHFQNGNDITDEWLAELRSDIEVYERVLAWAKKRAASGGT